MVAPHEAPKKIKHLENRAIVFYYILIGSKRNQVAGALCHRLNSKECKRGLHWPFYKTHRAELRRSFREGMFIFNLINLSLCIFSLNFKIKENIF